MILTFGAAGLAKLTLEESRRYEFEIFLLSLTPAIVYLSVAASYWFIYAKRRSAVKLAVIVLPLLLWLLYATAWPIVWVYGDEPFAVRRW